MKGTKRSFTLFELILVIVLFAIVLGFVAIKSNLLSKEDSTLNLKNLKDKLYKYDFDKSLSLKCSFDRCFLFIDGELNDDNFKLKLSNDITVYKYDDTQSIITFKDISLENLESYHIVFEINFDKDKKHKDMIVYNHNKVYIFNNIYNSPIVLSSLGDINDFFYNLKKEVKDSAF